MVHAEQTPMVPRAQVVANDADVARYALPQLPDGEADDIYERLYAAEHRLAGPDGTLESYADGVAGQADDLYIALGAGPLLVTTEHATHQARRLRAKPGRRTKEAEPGTAALGALLYEDADATHMTPLGRQSGDANDDPEHPFKSVLRPLLVTQQIGAHFSLHGMAAGRVSELSDTRGYNVLLGIGSEPTEETRQLVTRIREVARTYDLRVQVNQPVLRFDAEGVPRRQDDGQLQTITFAAGGENTTRAYTQRTAAALGQKMAAVQFELSPVHRLQPSTEYPRADRSHRLGLYLGYLFLRDSARLATPTTGFLRDHA